MLKKLQKTRNLKTQKETIIIVSSLIMNQIQNFYGRKMPVKKSILVFF